MYSRKQIAKWWKCSLIYPLHALCFYILLRLFHILPMDYASYLGGRIGRLLGPCITRHSHVAKKNIQRIFPHLSESERKSLFLDMWDNLGRTVAELPHLRRILDVKENRIEIINQHILEELSHKKQPSILVSGHTANWELLVGIGTRFGGRHFTALYRQFNNPYVEQWVYHLRKQATDHVTLIPKKQRRGFHLIRALKLGHMVGMLMDQHYQNGCDVTFLGYQAWTIPIPAALALRMRCPLILACIERLKEVHFRVTIFPPLVLPDSGVWSDNVRDLTQKINDMLGEWILERPAQWLWLHQRWRN